MASIVNQFAGAITGAAKKEANAVGKVVSPRPGVQLVDNPQTTYGTVDNPDYLQWAATRRQLDAQAASDPSWKNDPNGYQASLNNLGPAPPQTVQVDTSAAANARSNASGAQAVNTLNASANRILNMAQGYTAPPAQTVQQTLASVPRANGGQSLVTQGVINGANNPVLVNAAQQVGNLYTGGQAYPNGPGAKPATTSSGAPANPGALAAGADPTNPYNAQYAQAKQDIASSVAQANAAALNPTSGTPNYAAQGQAAAGRQAPQIQSSSAGQQAALAAAQGFRPDTSGISAISNARADTSGVANVAGFNPDNTLINQLSQYDASGTRAGANALEGFNPTDAQQGVQALNTYAPVQARQGIADLKAFTNNNTLGAALDLQGLDQASTRQAATGLQGFTAQNGAGALQNYANEAEGPSAAQALLQSGSDANIRQALALARSARGGPAAVAQALRQAQGENAATQSVTSGQAAALRAQETNDYKTRQLQALSNAGQLISASEAQRLSAQQSAGQLLSQADAQKLGAYQSAAATFAAADAQRLSAVQSTAQLRSTQDQQKLQATAAAADLQGQISGQKLSALQSSGQLLSQADAQRLGALSSAGGLQSNADAQRLSAAQSAASDLLQGSQINQQGAIAASNAQLTASGQQLQALSLQGQISDQIRTADIDVLKSNQSAALQQLNLNDTQVRQFAQIQEDARQANQTAQLQATQMGVNAQQVAQSLNLQWEQFAQSKLDTQQQVALQQQGLAQGLLIQNQQTASQQAGQLTQLFGTAALAAGTAYASDERVKTDVKPVDSRRMASALRASPGADYRYKTPEKHGTGRHVGPMAQALQRSGVFAGAVEKGADGTLIVSGGRLALAQHAALSHLQKEIDEIKKHRRSSRKSA